MQGFAVVLKTQSCFLFWPRWRWGHPNWHTASRFEAAGLQHDCWLCDWQGWREHREPAEVVGSSHSAISHRRVLPRLVHKSSPVIYSAFQRRNAYWHQIVVHDVKASCTTGTSDRVLLLSGSLHSVLTAIFLILEKITRDNNGTGGPQGRGGRNNNGNEDAEQVSPLGLLTD